MPILIETRTRTLTYAEGTEKRTHRLEHKQLFWAYCDHPKCTEGTPDFDTLEELRDTMEDDGAYVREGYYLCPLHYKIAREALKETGHGIAN